MTAALLFLAAIASLAAAAFCAGAETGFLSVSRERILHLARAGGRKAKIVDAALSDMGRTMTTLLIGNNIASVTYSSSTAAFAAALGMESTTRMFWNLAAAFFILYCSEFSPKLICAARPLRSSLALADAYRSMAVLLRPLTAIAIALTNLFVPRKESKYKLTADDLVRILQDRKDGVCVSDIESALISRIIVLKAKRRPITSEALLDALREHGQCR